MGNNPLLDVFCKYFLLACGLPSHSLDPVFCRAVFNFREVQPIGYFIHGTLVFYLKSHSYVQGHLGFLLFFSRSFIVLCFTFKSVIHVELVFVKAEVCA